MFCWVLIRSAPPFFLFESKNLRPPKGVQGPVWNSFFGIQKLKTGNGLLLEEKISDLRWSLAFQPKLQEGLVFGENCTRFHKAAEGVFSKRFLRSRS